MEKIKAGTKFCWSDEEPEPTSVWEPALLADSLYSERWAEPKYLICLSGVSSFFGVVTKLCAPEAGELAQCCLIICFLSLSNVIHALQKWVYDE